MLISAVWLGGHFIGKSSMCYETCTSKKYDRWRTVENNIWRVCPWEGDNLLVTE